MQFVCVDHYLTLAAAEKPMQYTHTTKINAIVLGSIPSWQSFNVVMGVECVHLSVSNTGTAYGILLKEN